MPALPQPLAAIPAIPGATDPAPGTSALAMLAEVLDAASLQEAAGRLAKALALALDLRWVAIATVADGIPTLMATSSRDDVSAQQSRDASEPIGAAMSEALDQGISLAVPEAIGAPRRHAVLLAHRILQSRLGGSIASVPVAAHGKAIAVVMLLGEAPWTAHRLQAVEDLLVLAGPALSLMQQAELPWHRRFAAVAAERWQAWLGTRRRAWAVAGCCVAGFALLALPTTQRAGGQARVEGAQQRVLVAPADGYVREVHVRPGDVVSSGAVLVDLTEAELVLDRDQWRGQLEQHENAYAAAMARADRASAMVSLAKLEEARVQLARVEGQLVRAQVVAPFDGMVIQGDLAASVGAPVRQGDALMTLSAGDGFRIVVEVDEADIARIQPGQPGVLALSAMPWDTLRLRVRRIAPLARVVEGANVFDVEAVLEDPDPRLRAGLLGRARIDVGERPLAVQWGLGAAARLRRLSWRWLW